MASAKPAISLWSFLPPRPSTQAYPTQEPGLPTPPLAPKDLAGTSLRLILHDTQKLLQQFSERIDGLLMEGTQARQSLEHTSKLVENCFDELTNNITGLVNRSQIALKVSMGQPAQEGALTALTKDVGTSITKLDLMQLQMTTLVQQTHTLLDLVTRLETAMPKLDQAAVLSSLDKKLDHLLAKNEQLNGDLTSLKTYISPMLDLPARMTALEASLSDHLLKPKTPKRTPRKRRASPNESSPPVYMKRRRLNPAKSPPTNTKLPSPTHLGRESPASSTLSTPPASQFVVAMSPVTPVDLTLKLTNRARTLLLSQDKFLDESDQAVDLFAQFDL